MQFPASSSTKMFSFEYNPTLIKLHAASVSNFIYARAKKSCILVFSCFIHEWRNMD
uniref:Uncharacterized protein n=1 Tax=Arundo donax TaxID=35708 RepID=A0A0A9C5Y8_ARUDO